MRLTTDERLLIAAALRHARHDAWVRGKRNRNVWRNGRTVVRLGLPELVRKTVFVGVGQAPLHASGPAGTVRAHTVAEALDFLTAIGVLPQKFSSAFQAGQESALPSEQWRLSNGPVQWGRSDSRADAERQRAKAMDHFSEVWLERRLYGATAWVRVPEAGDTDEH